jgi:hypothetical protein
MADQSVGFGFQADIVNAGSVAHLITGRVLKALSDGNVDVYAVTASVWLGAKFSVRSDLESSVHSHIAAKRGYQSVLVKALSIGWGHSTVPVEMSRTKAGTNALLLIGALSAGSSYHFAGQCLSQLMSLWGCDPTSTPITDRLRDMAAYLAPFVQDMGFAKVLEHVTTSTIHELVRLSRNSPEGLTAIGDAPTLASAIKQLTFTSQRSETLYMVVKQRGAWLAAFASYILGMSVEILYGETVVWGCGGLNGLASLQILTDDKNGQALQPVKGLSIVSVAEPLTKEGRADINIDYLLGEALGAELGKIPLCEPDLISATHCAIAMHSFALTHRFNGMCPNILAEDRFETRDGKPSTRACFTGITAMEETLVRLNLEHNAIKSGWAAAFNFATINDTKTYHLHTLLEKLPKHKRDAISRLVKGFSSTAFALAQCKPEITDVRISAEVVSGLKYTTWTRELETSFPLGILCLLQHLSALFHGSVADAGIEPYAHTDEHLVLGFSGNQYTILYACLIEHEAFDNLGRFVTITSGQASIEGNRRPWIIDGTSFSYLHGSHVSQLEYSTISSGSLLEPHFRPSQSSISMVAQLKDRHTITVETTVRRFDGKWVPVNLAQCHSKLWNFDAEQPCRHNTCEPFLVTPQLGAKLAVTGFSPLYRGRTLLGTIIVIALRGRRLEQLLQMALSRSPSQNFLQLHSCFRCTLEKVLSADGFHEKEGDWFIIMGG